MGIASRELRASSRQMSGWSFGDVPPPPGATEHQGKSSQVCSCAEPDRTRAPRRPGRVDASCLSARVPNGPWGFRWGSPSPKDPASSFGVSSPAATDHGSVPHFRGHACRWKGRTSRASLSWQVVGGRAWGTREVRGGGAEREGAGGGDSLPRCSMAGIPVTRRSCSMLGVSPGIALVGALLAHVASKAHFAHHDSSFSAWATAPPKWRCAIRDGPDDNAFASALTAACGSARSEQFYEPMLHGC